MHPLMRVVRQVDRTHPGLGQLVAVAVLSVLARRTLLIVGPAGTGKSTVGQALRAQGWPVLPLDQLTAASLEDKGLAASLSGSILWVDDLGKAQTGYGRLATLSLVTELVYSGWLERHSWRSHARVSHYEGAAILNVQPVLLREIMLSPVWHSTLRDKTVRYYHLQRPSRLHPTPPVLGLPELSWNHVSPTGPLKGKWAHLLEQIGEVQWGEARRSEHMGAYVYAAAHLAGRERPHPVDYRIAARLLTPLVLERYIVMSDAPEEAWKLRSSLIVVLSWLHSYSQFSLTAFASTYRLTQTVVKTLCDELQADGWLEVRGDTAYATEHTRRLLDALYIKSRKRR